MSTIQRCGGLAITKVEYTGLRECCDRFLAKDWPFAAWGFGRQSCKANRHEEVFASFSGGSLECGRECSVGRFLSREMLPDWQTRECYPCSTVALARTSVMSNLLQEKPYLACRKHF